MILDELLEFCDATALNTGAAGTYLLGDVIDLGDAPTTQGIGAFGTQPVYLVIQVDTAATSGGAATGRFIIATDGTATVHFDSGAIAVASLTAGRLITITGLPLTRTYERYLGILQTTAVAAFTAGKINAFLTTDISSWAALPQAPNAAP
jgi:hypothetical protein